MVANGERFNASLLTQGARKACVLTQLLLNILLKISQRNKARRKAIWERIKYNCPYLQMTCRKSQRIYKTKILCQNPS
jgi:hypothetical protein